MEGVRQSENGIYIQEDALSREYLERYHAQHFQESQMLSTERGRLEIIRNKCGKNATEADVLCKFIEDEKNHQGYCDEYPKCIVYMPEVYSFYRFKGKIIIELFENMRMFFEIKLSKNSDFSRMHCVEISSEHRREIYRYHNILLSYKFSVPFVKKLLFSNSFRQHFLITTEPRIMGSITTKDFLSPKCDIFSFRECVLNA